MQVFTELPATPILAASAVTVGTFDGVHRGHQHLLATLRGAAESRGFPALALTFADMPYCYFRPDVCPRLLTLADEKIDAMRACGLDYLLIVPFDATIAEHTADDFVNDILVDKLGMKHMVIGPDFALGKNRGGNIARLVTLGQTSGFTVEVIREKILFGGEAISSTRVRGSVESGDVATAGEMLGRPFSLHGETVSGQQLGRTIGVPTINIKTSERKVLPAHGIYATRAYFEASADFETTAHPSATNVGVRPTVNGKDLAIEYHVIDEQITVAPQRSRLEFIERLRNEEKFPGLPELVAQMKIDIEQASAILKNSKPTNSGAATLR